MDACMLGEEDGHVCCCNVIIWMPNVYYICFVPQQLQCLATRISHYSAVECVELNFSHSSPISNSHLLGAKWPSLVTMMKRRSWRWLRQLRRMVNI